MTTKIDTKKLVLAPVPFGHKIKYSHSYETTDGKGLFQDHEGAWRTIDEAELYPGTRRLRGTDAWLEDSEGRAVAVGISTCNPKDTPVKKLGRMIAHNRCIKSFYANHVPHV